MPRREDVEGSGVTDSSLNSVSGCSVEFKTPKSMIGLKRDNANAESGLELVPFEPLASTD